MPQIPYPPLPLILSPLPVSPPLPASPTYPLGYRAAMIRLRAEAPSTSHSPPPHIILSHTRADTPSSGTPTSGTPPLLPISLPTSSPSLLLPFADHGANRPEVCLPPRKRLCFAFGPRAPATDDTELGRRMTEFTTRVRQDTDDIYMRLDDEQTKRQLMVGQLNMLYRDRRAHARTALLIERERLGCLERLGDDPWTLVILHVQRCSARFFCWPHGLLFFKLLSWPSIAKTVGTQVQFIEALKLLKRLQTQMTEFESQQGPAKGPAQPDAPEEAGSSS
ncbi:hypothetical protein Tco_0026365 [Tanacetum coccineum]